MPTLQPLPATPTLLSPPLLLLEPLLQAGFLSLPFFPPQHYSPLQNTGSCYPHTDLLLSIRHLLLLLLSFQQWHCLKQKEGGERDYQLAFPVNPICLCKATPPRKWNVKRGYPSTTIGEHMGPRLYLVEGCSLRNN